MNGDNVEDQKPEYKGRPINLHILGQPTQLYPYVSIAMIQPLPNNVELQYAHSGVSFAPNVQPGGNLLKRALQMLRL